MTWSDSTAQSTPLAGSCVRSKALPSLWSLLRFLWASSPMIPSEALLRFGQRAVASASAFLHAGAGVWAFAAPVKSSRAKPARMAALRAGNEQVVETNGNLLSRCLGRQQAPGRVPRSGQG